MAADSYLPPVVVNVIGTDADLVAKLEAAKKALQDFSKQKAEARLGGDTKPLVANVAAAKKILDAYDRLSANAKVGGDTKPLVGDITHAKTELLAFAREVYKAKLGADATPLFAEITKLRAELKAMSPLDVNVTANTGLAMAKIAALRSSVVDSQLGSLIASAGGGGDGGGLAALLGSAAGGGGGGGGGKGLAAALAGFFTAKTGRFGHIKGPLGLGLGVAGVGVDHIAMAIIGLVGSAIGAALGGGILAGSALAVTGVGMGSNALVGSSTIADTKQIYAALGAISQAQARYGANSQAARNAKQDYAALITSLGGNTPGVQAEAKLAQATQALNAYWDKATSSARVAAVHLYTEFLSVARTYIPLISAQAKNGFQILSKDLQPLLAWINSPKGGQAIFKQLGGQYTRQLPTAISAFTNGLEVLFKTIAYVAPQTGKFLQTINTFFLKLNTAAGQKRTDSAVQGLITDFHAWEAFIKLAVEDVYQLFHAEDRKSVV